MFDNPEKLFIIMLIALFIFGPQKLIGLGGAMGRAIRDFRGAVRDAHERFSDAAAEMQKTEDDYTMSAPAALPAPEPLIPTIPEPLDTVPTAQSSAPETAGFHTPAAGAEIGSAAAAESSDLEGPDSLASEPPSRAVLESLQESLQRKG